MDEEGKKNKSTYFGDTFHVILDAYFERTSRIFANLCEFWSNDDKSGLKDGLLCGYRAVNYNKDDYQEFLTQCFLVEKSESSEQKYLTVDNKEACSEGHKQSYELFLCMNSFCTGNLPDDDEMILQCCGVTSAKKDDIRKYMSGYFSDKFNCFLQENYSTFQYSIDDDELSEKDLKVEIANDDKPGSEISPLSSKRIKIEEKSLVTIK